MRKIQHVLTILFIGLCITFTSAQTQCDESVAAIEKQTNACTGESITETDFVVPAGDNVLLVVVATGQWQPQSVTYNSQTLTKFAEMHNLDNGYHVTAGLYYLKMGNVATDITSNVVVDWTGSFQCCFKTINTAVFTNVNQTTPLNNQDSIHHADNTTAPSLDITSTADDMVMDFLVGKRNSGITAGNFVVDASQTQITTNSVKPSSAATNRIRVATSYELSTGATTTMSWAMGYADLTTLLHVGVNIQSAGVLPVELVNFLATEHEDEVILNWQTASEKINEGFEIERSADGKHWGNIGFVAGHGTTTEVHDYTFIDDEPIIGQSYYRLKQIDYDGAFEYSDVVAVNYENSIQNVNIQLFPNPVINQLQITDGQGQATIYNTFGQAIQSFDIQQSPFKINTSELPKGQYILYIQQKNGNVITKQFIK